jgi:hypothetical protein
MELWSMAYLARLSFSFLILTKDTRDADLLRG